VGNGHRCKKLTPIGAPQAIVTIMTRRRRFRSVRSGAFFWNSAATIATIGRSLRQKQYHNPTVSVSHIDLCVSNPKVIHRHGRIELLTSGVSVASSPTIGR
jgi:hypothetical protein